MRGHSLFVFQYSICSLHYSSHLFPTTINSVINTTNTINSISSSTSKCFIDNLGDINLKSSNSRN